MFFKALRHKRWSQIKWVIIELGKTLSSKPSFFSSKRLERWAAFTTGETFLVVYFGYHFKELTYVEALALAGAAFTIAGYTLHATQKEKKLNQNPLINDEPIEEA